VRLLGLLTLIAHGSLAVTPCMSPPGGFEPRVLVADAEFGARPHWSDAWCLGADAPEPPPVMNVVCPCGCERPGGLAGPKSLDHGLLVELAELEDPDEDRPYAAPISPVTPPTAKRIETPPRVALS